MQTDFFIFQDPSDSFLRNFKGENKASGKILEPLEGQVARNQEEMGFLTTLIGVAHDQGLPESGGLIMPDSITEEVVSEKNQLMSLEKLFEDKVPETKPGGEPWDYNIKANVRLIQNSGGSTMSSEQKGSGVEKGDMKNNDVIKVSYLSDPGEEEGDPQTNDVIKVSCLSGLAEEDGLKLRSTIQPSNHTTQKTEGDLWIGGSKANVRLIQDSGRSTMSLEQKGSGVEKGDMKTNDVIKVSSLSNLAEEHGLKLEKTTLSFDHTMEKAPAHPETEESEKRLLLKLRMTSQNVAGETDKAIIHPDQNRLSGDVNWREPPRNLNINSQGDDRINTHPSKDQPLEGALLKLKPGLQDIETMVKRMDVLLRDKAGNEAAGIDSASRGNTLSFPNSQFQERISETMVAAKETEFLQKPLQTIVLKQLVERAATDLNSGRTAIKINLKPEYLGYLRMKISTENHHVMVKIMTEIPLVKEIIENNINQLRAGLAGHGLEMDDLDVFVAHDSDKHEGRDRHTEFTSMESEARGEGEKSVLSREEDHVILAAEEISEENIIDFFA